MWSAQERKNFEFKKNGASICKYIVDSYKYNW